MPHRNAARSLLEAEVAQVREHERELVLVVWPTRSLVTRLNDDDAEFSRRDARKRADTIRELVVGDEDPTALASGQTMRGKALEEGLHRAGHV
jgi:hypothetical protein